MKNHKPLTLFRGREYEGRASSLPFLGREARTAVDAGNTRDPGLSLSLLTFLLVTLAPSPPPPELCLLARFLFSTGTPQNRASE